MEESSDATVKSSSSSSGGYKSSQSGSTLPVGGSQTELNDDFGIHADDNVWGLLMPYNSEYSRVELIDGKLLYKFGRNNNCDYVFTYKSNSDFNEERKTFVNQISSFHFEIEKVQESGSIHTVNIIDKSSNGTFVNSERLIKGKSFPLNNGDVIALNIPSKKAFFYIAIDLAKSEINELPYDFRSKYVIEHVLLGEGTSGVVRRGVDKSTYVKVAVKIISKTKTLSFIHDITYEASLMKSVAHSNIVKVLDVYENEKKVWIILEYIDGGDLFDRIREKGPIEEDICRNWFTQLLNAVGHLHSKNILHRDLKPENILLVSSEDDEKCILKLTDFNLSRFVSEESLVKTVVGTGLYLAPEIRNPLSEGYTHLVDCWSLGCILYVMLGGYTPFDPSREIYPQVAKGKYSFPDQKWGNISECAKDLIRKLMEVDPKNRLDVNLALKHDWLRKSKSGGNIPPLLSTSQSNSSLSPQPSTSEIKRRLSSLTSISQSNSSLSPLPSTSQSKQSLSSLTSSSESNSSLSQLPSTSQSKRSLSPLPLTYKKFKKD